MIKREFIEWAKDMAKTSSCYRTKVGCVFEKDGKMVASGTNRNVLDEYCSPETCPRKDAPHGERLDDCTALHAEQVAILSADNIIDLRDSSVYLTLQPCNTCAKMLIAVGVKEVYYLQEYPDQLSLNWLNEAGIKVKKVEE